jgi:hypothetical protein
VDLLVTDHIVLLGRNGRSGLDIPAHEHMAQYLRKGRRQTTSPSPRTARRRKNSTESALGCVDDGR